MKQTSVHSFDAMKWLCPIALLAALTYPVLALITAPLSMDELEFYRATMWVAQGKIPYLDFWEHHFPLQWYIMAPFTALTHNASVSDFLIMRWAQVPLWAGTALLLVYLLHRRGIRLRFVLMCLTILFSASFFYRCLVEFRIDVPMNFFFLLGIVCLEAEYTGARHRYLPFLAGLCLAAASLCSQRFMPMAIIVVLVYGIIPRDGRWGFRKDIVLTVLAGILSILTVFATYWWLGGISELWNQGITQNFLYEAAQRSIDNPSFVQELFLVPIVTRDIPTYILYLLATGGMVIGFRRLLKPDLVTRFALLTILQFAVLTTIRSPFIYQFESLFWLLCGLSALFVSWLSEHLKVRKTVFSAAASLVIIISLVGSGFRGRWMFPAEIQEHQDHIIRLVHRLTRPGEPVLDGSGYGLDRPPVFRRWFLPRLARLLTLQGYFKPLTRGDLERNTPGAIVMDSRLSTYLSQVTPSLIPFITRNYLPLETVVWVPGPNALLTPKARAHKWTVLRSGIYKVAVSRKLARSPWFTRPLGFARLEVLDLVYGLNNGRRYTVSTRTLPPFVNGNDVLITRNGTPLVVSLEGTCALKRGDRISARLKGASPRAVMFFPGPYPVFFWVPFPRIPSEPALETR